MNRSPNSVSAPPIVRSRSAKLQLWIPAALLPAALLWSYWPTIYALFKDWQSDDNYSVGPCWLTWLVERDHARREHVIDNRTSADDTNFPRRLELPSSLRGKSVHPLNDTKTHAQKTRLIVGSAPR